MIGFERHDLGAHDIEQRRAVARAAADVERPVASFHASLPAACAPASAACSSRRVLAPSAGVSRSRKASGALAAATNCSRGVVEKGREHLLVDDIAGAQLAVDHVQSPVESFRRPERSSPSKFAPRCGRHTPAACDLIEVPPGIEPERQDLQRGRWPINPTNSTRQTRLLDRRDGAATGRDDSRLTPPDGLQKGLPFRNRSRVRDDARAAAARSRRAAGLHRRHVLGAVNRKADGRIHPRRHADRPFSSVLKQRGSFSGARSPFLCRASKARRSGGAGAKAQLSGHGLVPPQSHGGASPAIRTTPEFDLTCPSPLRSRSRRRP